MVPPHAPPATPASASVYLARPAALAEPLGRPAWEAPTGFGPFSCLRALRTSRLCADRTAPARAPRWASEGSRDWLLAPKQGWLAE